MKRTIVQHIAVFILGIIAGISLLNLFSTDEDNISTVQVEDPAAVTARIAATEVRYQGKIDSLAATNTSLQVKVSFTQTALKQAKRKQQALEQTVLELTAVQQAATDTITLLENCDSLAVAALELLDQHQFTDSLNASIIGDLQVQLNNKDSTILLQQEQYDHLKTTLDSTLTQQQSLMQAVADCHRQLRKQKRGKKLMAALLFIGAGVTAAGAMR
jgi:hypothetical protein